MKKILFTLFVVFTCSLSGQYTFVKNNTTSNMYVKTNPKMYDYVQQVLSKKPVHIHTDSFNNGFTICCTEPNQEFKIVDNNGNVVHKGKVEKNHFISTNKWSNGTYTLFIGGVQEVILLMKS